MSWRFFIIAIALVAAFWQPAQAADETEAAQARASLERLRALRAERPGDGVLAYCWAWPSTHAGASSSR